MQTTVSDDEIEYVEETAPFYSFQYGPFQIGTVRPETKFGDKYVVMHPDDDRYKEYKHGDTFECEWINGKITATVIKDKEIDPEMGTGVMTITPSHSSIDFEIAEHHDLDKEQIIDFEGKLLPIAGEFAGMDIEDARPKIAEKLDQKGLLVGIDENYVHNVSVNYRGKGKVEPQIKKQWFIDVNRAVVKWKGQSMSLKQVMQDVIRSGDIKLIPERFDKVYFHWIDNLRDWCISRQIWWGHRVPVWYHQDRDSSDMHVGVEEPEGDSWNQDPDTLDTWFSSALWTWSTLIDKDLTKDLSLSLEEMLEQSPEYKKFHPTQVMETGYDILFFWVARMILMTTYATGQIPFDTVYLHGMVRTREGKKMSKSDPETCIDPLEIIPEFGTDALRLSMIVGQSPGNDFRLYKEKIAGYRNFINKLWNASRFVLMQCEEAGVDPNSLGMGNGELGVGNLSLADKAVLSALQDLITDVTEGLAEYRLSEVGERLYSFVWDYFCDWYLELSKGESNPAVLIHVLRSVVSLLHPYCPFVTEELWEQIKPEDADMLMKQDWISSDSSLKDQKSFDQLQIVIDVVTAIRQLRPEYGVEPGKKIKAIVHTKHTDLLESQKDHIIRLGRLSELTISSKPEKHKNAASEFLSEAEVHLPLEGIIDIEKQKKNLEKDKKELDKYVSGLKKKLDNKEFKDNAPEEVVAGEKEKLSEAEEKLKKISDRLESLG